MAHFTLKDLLNFTEKENDMVKDFNSVEEHVKQIEPSDDAVRNILAYNKAVSAREGNVIRRYRFVLN